MIRQVHALFAVIESGKSIIIKNIIDPERWKVAGISAAQETRSSLAEGIMKPGCHLVVGIRSWRIIKVTANDYRVR
jgi:hypothetical protein